MSPEKLLNFLLCVADVNSEICGVLGKINIDLKKKTKAEGKLDMKRGRKDEGVGAKKSNNSIIL